MQWDGKDFAAAQKWAGLKAGEVLSCDERFKAITIKTPEGLVDVSPTDWLMKGSDGEINAVTSEFFNACFEPIIPESSIILPGLGARLN